MLIMSLPSSWPSRRGQKIRRLPLPRRRGSAKPDSAAGKCCSTTEQRGLKRLQIYWNVEWLQCVTLGCTKLSFLFLYYRIFSQQHRAFNAILFIMIAICAVWATGFFLGAMLTCPGNVSAYWIHRDRSKYCFNTKPYLSALSWSDMVTDLIILVLPIPMASAPNTVWRKETNVPPQLLRLQMTMQKKLAIIGIFMLGGLSVLRH
jgi:hypothetical protein